jgi:hypothetical protein
MTFFVAVNGNPCPVQKSGNTFKLTKPKIIGLLSSSSRKSLPGSAVKDYHQTDKTHGDMPFYLVLLPCSSL